jgi:phospholipid/cholesterol/gamma-HCH transport system substrate-binding protein
MAMTHTAPRVVAGTVTLAAIVVVVVLAGGMFQGRFIDSVALTVMSQRAGLVMNPDAKVKLLGVQVGKVAFIEERPNGQAAIHLAIDPSQFPQIPANVIVDIASSTVFGAKSVDLVPPPNPSPEALQPGQVLDAGHVTVEIDTIFQQLTSVLSKIQPEKLSETLGAIASALNGRGQQLGQMLSHLDELLAKLDPSLPNLTHDIEVAPTVINAYADAAPDLLQTVSNGTRISQTVVDEQRNLDALLISTIGLADIGNDVIGSNRQGLTDVLHLLVPTTDLTNQYNQALYCGIAGIYQLSTSPPLPVPGVFALTGVLLGRERYHYPSNLPKVAATGGPQCTDLPIVPMEARPPLVVADTGTNPAQYGNNGNMLNSDALKQFLYGPIGGPPRNSAQTGQPG